MSDLKLFQLRGDRLPADVQEAIRDPYALHQEMYRVFCPNADAPRRFLYRATLTAGPPRVYVQARGLPHQGAWQANFRRARLDYPAGFELNFLLRANVTKKVDGVRHGAISHALRLGASEEDATEAAHVWLERQGGHLGFDLVTPETVDGFETVEVKPGVRLEAVDFSGTLRVTDSEKFGGAIERGVGRGRGFGFGLLMLKL